MGNARIAISSRTQGLLRFTVLAMRLTEHDFRFVIQCRPVTSTGQVLGSPAHMCWEVFSSGMGGNLKVNHVPYKSGLESAQAVMADQVDFASSYIGSAFPIINQKQARGLAITSRNRLKVLPEVPTIAETVLPKFEYLTLLFYGAPRGTPANIVQALYDAIARASKSKEMLAQLDALAHQLDVSASPQAFAQQLQTVLASESKLILERGITAGA